MDWTLVIDLNRTAFLHIVGRLFVVIGLVPGDAMPETLLRHVHVRVTGTVRRIEAGVRRLIVIVARDMTAPEPVTRTASGTRKPRGKSENSGSVPAFPLFDPRKRVGMPPRRRYAKTVRMTVIGVDPWTPFKKPRLALPDDPVDAAALCRRLLAIKHALDDLPKQARRLVRALARPSCKWQRPMRPGRPPGHRTHGRARSDTMLASLQVLALWALDPPDTG